MTSVRPHPFDALDAALRAIGSDDALLAKLSRQGLHSFTRGGCLMLAEGVAAWAGEAAIMQVVVEEGEPQHVVIEFGPLWLDAGGARDRSDFEFDLEQFAFTDYEIVTLAELAVGARYPLNPTGLRRDPALSALITKRLTAAVSAAEVWAAAEKLRIR